jgi:hypothetical protein
MLTCYSHIILPFCWHSKVVSYCTLADMLRSYHAALLLTCYGGIILPSCWHATVVSCCFCYSRIILHSCWHATVVSYCPLVDMLRSYHAALVLTCYGRIILHSCWHAMVVSYCPWLDPLLLVEFYLENLLTIQVFKRDGFCGNYE